MKGQACGWAYQLAPAETDADEDFSAVWIQIEIDPGPGCASLMAFELTLPPGARIVSAVPSSDGRARELPTTTEIIVDGDGGAPVPGVIAQDIAPESGTVSVSLFKRRFRYVWLGRSRDKIAAAIGVQLAHKAPLDSWFAQWSEMVAMGGGSCRPMMTSPFRGRGRG